MERVKAASVVSRIFSLEKSTRRMNAGSYVRSYPSLLKFFDRQCFNADEAICGMHMVYGWMQTILEINHHKTANAQVVAELLTAVKTGHQVTDENLDLLSEVMNNSLVGATKLLHFVDPEQFAIWDARIYSFFCGMTKHYPSTALNNKQNFRKYMSLLMNCKSDSRFQRLNESVNRKVA